MIFSFRSEQGFRNVAKIFYDVSKYVGLTSVVVPAYQYVSAEDTASFSANMALTTLSLVVLVVFLLLAYLFDCIADYIKEKKEKLA